MGFMVGLLMNGLALIPGVGPFISMALRFLFTGFMKYITIGGMMFLIGWVMGYRSADRSWEEHNRVERARLEQAYREANEEAQSASRERSAISRKSTEEMKEAQRKFEAELTARENLIKQQNDLLKDFEKDIPLESNDDAGSTVRVVPLPGSKPKIQGRVPVQSKDPCGPGDSLDADDARGLQGLQRRR